MRKFISDIVESILHGAMYYFLIVGVLELIALVVLFLVFAP